ncbi:hypothetical protein D5086_006804 [Populus alba]|uniref:Uncharacterized protein n=1 Tax=Populus alba TaxID=43335 RepID=A0ACC4CLZ1_POPAL
MASHATSLQDKMMRLQYALFLRLLLLVLFVQFPLLYRLGSFSSKILCFVCVSGCLADFTLLWDMQSWNPNGPECMQFIASTLAPLLRLCIFILGPLHRHVQIKLVMISLGFMSSFCIFSVFGNFEDPKVVKP